MNSQWEKKKLSDVCKIKPPKKEVNNILDFDDQVSFVPMEDLGLFKKDINLKQARKLSEVVKNYTYFAENDVLLAKITPCFENGKLGIARGLTNGIGFGSSEFIVFRTNEYLDPEFLFYFFCRNKVRYEGIKRMTGAVGHKRVPKDFIENCKINYPPLNEQKRIVKILDEVFDAIDKAKLNAERNLKNCKELFEAYLNNIFSNNKDWEKKKLGEVCDIIGGGTPSKANKKYYSGRIYWATVRDMKDSTIRNTEYKITKDAVKNSSTHIIPKGNVVIATRVGLGKVCFLENDTAINQDLKGVVPKNINIINISFLFRWFKSISDKIVNEGTGATVKGVKLSYIKSLKIPLPKISEQKQIVSKLDELSAETKRLEEIYKKKMDSLDELKKSILEKAFKGEL